MTDAIKLTVQRVEKYIAERARMRGLDKELIHGLHSDDPREAELLVSDLSAMVAALRVQPVPGTNFGNIKIPTDTMEQEFQTHYHRGYEAGKKVVQSDPDKLVKVVKDLLGRLEDADYLIRAFENGCDANDYARDIDDYREDTSET